MKLEVLPVPKSLRSGILFGMLEEGDLFQYGIHTCVKTERYKNKAFSLNHLVELEINPCACVNPCEITLGKIVNINQEQ